MRVLIVDDNQAFAESLGQYLERQDDIDAVEIAGSADEAVVVIGEREPAVVLMDYGLGSLGMQGGVSATRMIRQARPNARVVIITAHDDRERLMDALDAGAIGWISKTQRLVDILLAIRAADEGRTMISASDPDLLLGGRAALVAHPLTPREVAILRWVSEGKTTRWMADQAFISEHTVRNHLRHIFKKLEVHSRLEAVSYAIRNGLIRMG
jgi:DNA-binding NarL/FixJ family response regulator